MALVPYTVPESHVDSAPCAICGRTREPKHTLMPDPQQLGAPSFETPETVSGCGEYAPSTWAPGTRVSEQGLANLRQANR